MTAAAKDLINLTRAYQQLQGVSNVDTLLQTFITAASDGIAKYCRRDFYSRDYDELYDGNGERNLLLRAYPIQKVTSVRYRPVTVLKITNTTAANVQARVSVTSTGLSLFTSNAGTPTTDTTSVFATYPTLTNLAAHINGLGSGWSAQVVGDATNYGGWPSADLWVKPSFGDGLTSQGAKQCVNGSFAELKMHTYELQGFEFDPRGWVYRQIPYTDPELILPEDLVFPRGIQNFRVQYTAGYTTIPEAVQQACAQWVGLMYRLANRDQTLISEASTSSGTTSASTFRRDETDDGPPQSIRGLLAPYRRRTV
jgi:hypothetical protein